MKPPAPEGYPPGRAVLLDTSPLSLLTERPGKSRDVIECRQWLLALRQTGALVYLPEITDYELRRELLRAGQSASIARLDDLRRLTRYLPITTRAMRLAASLWADARNQGRPTAPDLSLDADVILAAQARTVRASSVVIATSNPGHLGRYVPALP